MEFKVILVVTKRTMKSRNTVIIDIFKKSRAVLDIPIAGQNGLTMRTFECLAMKKKIVTTNENIKQYAFRTA